MMGFLAFLYHDAEGLPFSSSLNRIPVEEKLDRPFMNRVAEALGAIIEDLNSVGICLFYFR